VKKKSKILTWFNFTLRTAGTMTEVVEDDEEAERSRTRPGRITDRAH
jgi:hypothetical protein